MAFAQVILRQIIILSSYNIYNIPLLQKKIELQFICSGYKEGSIDEVPCLKVGKAKISSETFVGSQGKNRPCV